MNKPIKTKNDEVINLKKLIEEKNDEIFLLRNIIDDLPGDIYWKHRVGDKLIYAGLNRTGTNSLHKMGFKWKIADILGKTDDNLFDKETADIFIKNDLEVIYKRDVRVKEETVILPSGKKIIQLSIKQPLLNKKGKVIGIAGVSIDITEFKETQSILQRDLKKANAANYIKSKILENIRHDIRIPLTEIIDCTQLIQSSTNDFEKLFEYRTNLIQACEALIQFFNKILKCIEIANGEIPLLKKKLDFKKNIQAIFDLKYPVATQKHLTLVLDFDEKVPPYVIGDPIRLQQIIFELLTNALKFTLHGSVNIKVKLNKQEMLQTVVAIKISDTGIGISSDELNKILDQFSSSQHVIYQGRGLGLLNVKRFIDDLNGKIYVDSRLNQGTTFTCLIPYELPLNDHNDLETSALSMKCGLLQNAHDVIDNIILKNLDFESKKILLIEEDELLAKFTQAILLKLNCIIDRVCNAKSALKEIQKQNYHLILMNIDLSDMHGIRLTQRIRLQQWQRTALIPIVGLTTYIDAENRQKCLDVGMNAVLIKPLNETISLALLKTYILDEQNIFLPDIRLISGPVLDIDSMKFLNDEWIKDCIQLMIPNLEKDLVKLSKLYQVHDWQTIYKIARKWKGIAAYCKTKRLESVCKKIIEYFYKGEFSEKHKNRLYQQLIQEMETTKEVLQNYK